MTTIRSLAASLTAALPLAACVAVAQTAATADAPVVRLEKVEVSAEKTTPVATSGVLGSRSVLDTPYSVSVVDRAELDRWQPKTTGEVFFADPSVVSTVAPQASGWRERLTVRGLGLDWNNYRLNGLPVETTTAEWPLDLMEQVELFKGVNGFMHGFGQPGGIVNYVTKQPLDRDYTATSFGYYSDTVVGASADISRRAGKDRWFGYRVNLGREFGETYANGDLDRSFGSIALDARVTDKLTLTAEFIHINRSLDDEAAHIYLAGLPAGAALPDPIDPGDLATVKGTFDDVSNTVATVGLDYAHSPDWKTSADYAYFRGRNDINKAFYDLTDPLGNYDVNSFQLSWDETDSHIVQSLTEGAFETGPFSHKFIGGASWQTRRSYSTAYDWFLIGTGNLYAGNGPLAPFPAHSNATRLMLEIVQTSVFASDTIELLPGLSALAGLRYNDYRQQAPGGSAYTAEEISPTYALIYKPRADLTLYASYVEALENGSVVDATATGIGPYTNAGDVLDPLTSEQFEIGLKYESRRWSAGIAAFRLERGANLTRDNGNGTATLIQDGVDLYQGVEVTGSVRVADPLTLTAGVIWLDATYDKLSTASASLEGNRIAGSARRQAVLQAVCQIPGLDGLEVYGGVRYFGDVYQNNTNTLELPDYTLANLGVGYSTVLYDRPVSFRAQVNNLTDKNYWGVDGLGAPRTYSLSAKIEW